MTYEEAKNVLKKGAEKFDIDLIRAYGIAIEALEKQIPSKPNEVLGLNGKEFCCPYCDEAIELIPRDKDETTYCLHCGQALDWSDAE